MALPAAGRLHAILEAYSPEVLNVSLVHLQRKHLPLKDRVFIDFVTERFRTLFRGG